jgi:hypothetical protein
MELKDGNCGEGVILSLVWAVIMARDSLEMTECERAIDRADIDKQPLLLWKWHTHCWRVEPCTMGLGKGPRSRLNNSSSTTTLPCRGIEYFVCYGYDFC